MAVKLAADSANGKICLVTGAGAGLARAMTLALADAGAHVFACDIDAHAVAQTKALAEARQPCGGVTACTLDVADPAQCAATVERVIAEAGRIDMLVNCAGLGPVYMRRDFLADPLRFWDADVERWRRMIEVNLHGAFYLARVAAPHMIAQKSGRIVNITTSFSTMMRGGAMPYGQTKAALEAGTASWADDLRGSGVTCNVLIPGGAADTAMIPADVMPDRSKLVPAAAMGPPIVFLASPASDGVTGKRFVAQHFDPQNPLSAPGCTPVAWPGLAAAASPGLGEATASRRLPD